MKKSVVGLIVIIAIFGAMLTTIIVKREYIFTKDKFYTQKEVDTISEKVREETKIEYADDTLLDKLDDLSIKRMELLIEKENLETQNKGLETTISELKTQIETLENEKASLEKQHNTDTETISNLIIQISELETQIITLENEKTQLNNELILKQSTIEEYEKTIEQLQNSVKYYEDYVSGILSDNQVTATFEYDNSVLCMQVVNKGSKLSVSVPEDTEYMIFNGWKVDGELIDLETYIIDSNVKLVADITYKYSVKFMVESSEYNTQIISLNEYAILPANPTRANCEFLGWSKDGISIIENIDSSPVTENVTYIALFTNIYKVTFMVDNVEYETQSIEDGGCPTLPSGPQKDGYKFLGWSIDNSNIINDISTYKITKNITFFAIFERFTNIDVKLVIRKSVKVKHVDELIGEYSVGSFETKECTISCSSTDSLFFYLYNPNARLALSIDTDGSYTISDYNNISYSYSIEWSNATYITITVAEPDNFFLT